MIVNKYKEIIVGRQKSTHLYEYLALKPPVYMTAFLKKKTEGFFQVYMDLELRSLILSPGHGVGAWLVCKCSG